MDKIKHLWKYKPYALILSVAALLRLISVIFSKGFGWHDDHFLVIEAAQSWVDGTDYNNWLPSSGATTPSGHSFFYVGIHFILLYILKFIGLTDPQVKMFVIRFLHAALSMITVALGYKITERLSNTGNAKIVGIMLAAYWFAPFLSVRNLVEWVCVPFLIITIWKIVNQSENKNLAWNFLLAGISSGIAINIRFQSVIFFGGIVLVMLLQKKIREAIILSVGCALMFVSFQGINDMLLWGRPFAEFQEYVIYNIENATNYINNPWFTYLILLLGILVPPVSFFLFFGFFKTWNRYLLIFLPTFIFLAFHSYFPNKQERFILPVVPFIIITGVIGWQEFVAASGFWQRNKKLLNGLYGFSIAISLIALPVVSVMYSKRARVESMVYLSKDKSIKSLVLEDTNHDDVKMPPRFYIQKWISTYSVSTNNPPFHYEKVFNDTSFESYPSYVLFFQDDNLKSRVDTMKKYFPALTYETTIEPGFVDDLLFKMNPKNANQTIYIYKIR